MEGQSLVAWLYMIDVGLFPRPMFVSLLKRFRTIDLIYTKKILKPIMTSFMVPWRQLQHLCVVSDVGMWSIWNICQEQ